MIFHLDGADAGNFIISASRDPSNPTPTGQSELENILDAATVAKSGDWFVIDADSAYEYFKPDGPYNKALPSWELKKKAVTEWDPEYDTEAKRLFVGSYLHLLNKLRPCTDKESMPLCQKTNFLWKTRAVKSEDIDKKVEHYGHHCAPLLEAINWIKVMQPKNAFNGNIIWCDAEHECVDVFDPVDEDSLYKKCLKHKEKTKGNKFLHALLQDFSDLGDAAE